MNRVASVNIAPQVVGGVAQQGDVTITAPITVYSDTVTDGQLSAYNVTGRNTTIGAKQVVTSLPGNAASTANRATLNTTQIGGKITVDTAGSLTAGNVQVGSPVVFGGNYAANPINLPELVVNGSIATTAAGQGALFDPNAGGGFAAAANPDFLFNGTSLTGSGVAGQGGITANVYDIYARGNVRSPVSPDNFLLNGLNLTPRPGAAAVPQVAVSAIGTSRQAVNLNVTGPVQLFSGVTVTPFANAQLTSGTNTAGAPVPNVQSSLIVQASGDLLVAGSFGTMGFDPLVQPYVPGNFYFPGGVVFKSPTSVVTGNIMNAWNTTGIQFQGAFFEAPAISTGWVAMSANQFANYSTNPVGGAPVTYHLVFGNNGATVNFIPGSHAYRSDDPAAVCGAGTGCTNTYSTILNTFLAGDDWVSVINTQPFN